MPDKYFVSYHFSGTSRTINWAKLFFLFLYGDLIFFFLGNNTALYCYNYEKNINIAFNWYGIKYIYIYL